VMSGSPGAGGAAGAPGSAGSAGSAGAGPTAGAAGGSAGAGGVMNSGGSPATDAGRGDAAVEGTCNTAPGMALQFDGTLVDLMSGDLGVDFPGGDVPRTIEVWAKFLGPQSWTAEHSLIETGLAQGGQNRVLGIDLSGYTGTTAQFGPYTNGYSDSNNPNGVYVPNTPQTGWLHLAWSYTGSNGTLSFTVNGTEFPVLTQGGQPTLNFTPGIVTLGASQTFGTQGWTGVMDEVRLWSVAKTPAEIGRDMQVVLRGTEPGLVAYYRFGEGSGTFTDDVSAAPGHRLSVCTATSPRCAAVNAANPVWVNSDLPGPFTCAP
jgi:Concanavalin A-like lectin/glucanases superfamily